MSGKWRQCGKQRQKKSSREKGWSLDVFTAFPPVLFLAFDYIICSCLDKLLCPTDHHSFHSSQNHKSPSPKYVLIYVVLCKEYTQGWKWITYQRQRLQIFCWWMFLKLNCVCSCFCYMQFCPFCLKYTLISWLFFKNPLRFKSSIITSKR